MQSQNETKVEEVETYRHILSQVDPGTGTLTSLVFALAASIINDMPSTGCAQALPNNGGLLGHDQRHNPPAASLRATQAARWAQLFQTVRRADTTTKYVLQLNTMP